MKISIAQRNEIHNEKCYRSISVVKGLYKSKGELTLSVVVVVVVSPVDFPLLDSFCRFSKKATVALSANFDSLLYFLSTPLHRIKRQGRIYGQVQSESSLGRYVTEKRVPFRKRPQF